MIRCVLFAKCQIVLLLAIAFPSASRLAAQELVPGKVVEINFSDEDLPRTLHSMVTGKDISPRMSVRLPDDFDPAKKYPLLVYLRGRDGGISGNIDKARDIAGDKGWVVASLPLFKRSLDRREIYGGIIMTFDDYPVMSKVYRTMLGRLFKLVPNVDTSKNAMVGFSNGAYAIAMLVSCQDEFVLEKFRNFGLIDSGYWYLNGLHTNVLDGARFLLLVGDKRDPQRDILIRQAQIIKDASQWCKVDVTLRFMQGTGHKFPPQYRTLVGKWLGRETLPTAREDP